MQSFYGAQQHNWPHFKTFVILISIGDASQIWYRWKALGEAHQGKFSISWKEVAYLNNVLFTISERWLAVRQ